MQNIFYVLTICNKIDEILSLLKLEKQEKKREKRKERETKMIIRDAYKQRRYGLSEHDEPGNDYLITANVRNYPNMLYAYKRFQQLFNLKDNTFFLANGCENAIKNVMLAIRPKNVLWNTPTWKMLEVYSEALPFKLIDVPFKYNGKEFIEQEYKKELDTYYCNTGITPCFKYSFNYDYLNKIKSRYNIVDLTYKSAQEMKEVITKLNTPDYPSYHRNIIVGSFDKIFGGGLRLGYAIYPEELHQIMSIQRENFINAAAVKLLTEITDFKQLENKNIFVDKLKPYLTEYDFITDNYLTIKGDVYSTFDCIKLTVDNQIFTRFGIPNNETEFEGLTIFLQDFRFSNNGSL